MSLAKPKRKVTLNPYGRVTSDIVADIEAEKRDKKVIVVTPDKTPDLEALALVSNRDILIPRNARVFLIPRNARVQAIFAEGE